MSLTVTVVHEVDLTDVTKGQTLEEDVFHLVSLTVTAVHEADHLDVTKGQTLKEGRHISSRVTHRYSCT